MPVDVRVIESDRAAELFLTYRPVPGLSVVQQAEAAFAQIRDVLKENRARIFQERVFVSPAAMESVAAARETIYGDLDDGVPPTWLTDQLTQTGRLAGVQVHAIRSEHPFKTLSLEGSPCGRLYPNSHGFLALSGLSGGTGSAAEQAHTMLAKAEQALRQVDGSIFSVARTWMWLRDILSWYGDFNKVRNQFFRQTGLITDDPRKDRLPASTGIGVCPASGHRCGMDLVALTADRSSLQYLLAGGDQDSAFKYGSAFSRASSITTPGGSTVYVSGTAAIDTAGKTEHVGDIPAQIEATIRHVRAVLGNMRCGDGCVVHSIMYCKTPEVERIFRKDFSDLPWPQVILVADVCRDDLLFEIEATACPGAKKL